MYRIIFPASLKSKHFITVKGRGGTYSLFAVNSSNTE